MTRLDLNGWTLEFFLGIGPHCLANFESGIMYVYAHSGAVVGLCVQRALDLFMSHLRRVPARVENTPNIFSSRKKTYCS